MVVYCDRNNTVIFWPGICAPWFLTLDKSLLGLLALTFSTLKWEARIIVYDMSDLFERSPSFLYVMRSGQNERGHSVLIEAQNCWEEILSLIRLGRSWYSEIVNAMEVIFVGTIFKAKAKHESLFGGTKDINFSGHCPSVTPFLTVWS